MGDVRVEPPGEAPRSLQLLDDHALIDLVRDGDERGLGELYRRHAPTALRAARSITHSGHEADDVVADVFDGIWRAIRNGKGPTTRFEPYLVTAIRNRARAVPTAASGQPIDDHIAALATVDAEPESGDNMARRAFATLAGRDQQVLWLTAVEGRTITEAAHALSVTKRAATTLKFRAKRAFAEAYLTEYGATGAALPACRELGSKLSRYVRGTCPPTVKRTVEAHMDECPACRQLQRELTNVNATLRTVGPAAGLVIGGRGLVSGGAPSVGDRLLHASLRASMSKPALLMAAAGVVALLPTAVLLGGDPPTPGPTIVDEAGPAPTTTILPDVPAVTRRVIGFADPDIDTNAPAAGDDPGGEREFTTDSRPGSSVASSAVVTPPATTTDPPGASVTPVPSVPLAPAATTILAPASSTTTTFPAEIGSESGIFIASDPDELDVELAVPSLVDSGVVLATDDEGLVIDVVLSVPLLDIPPIEIALPAVSLPELLPVLDVDLPLPDLALPQEIAPPTSPPPD